MPCVDLLSMATRMSPSSTPPAAAAPPASMPLCPSSCLFQKPGERRPPRPGRQRVAAARGTQLACWPSPKASITSRGPPPSTTIKPPPNHLDHELVAVVPLQLHSHSCKRHPRLHLVTHTPPLSIYIHLPAHHNRKQCSTAHSSRTPDPKDMRNRRASQSSSSARPAWACVPRCSLIGTLAPPFFFRIVKPIVVPWQQQG